jgi:hypothetical protein
VCPEARRRTMGGLGKTLELSLITTKITLQVKSHLADDLMYIQVYLDRK